MTPRVESKSSELVSIFHDQSGWNLARVKFFVLIISALCKVQTVGFEKLVLPLTAMPIPIPRCGEYSGLWRLIFWI